ncbi:MAG: hypothetical protein AAFY72_03540 [Cyanobacteria bacterium J06649_4]
MALSVNLGPGTHLATVLIAGLVELSRDLFDTSISVGTVHNRLQETDKQAAEINHKAFRASQSAYQTLFGLREAVSEYQNWHSKGSYGERAFNSLCHGSRSQKQDAFTKQLVGVHLR